MTEVEAIENICNVMERLSQNDESIQRQITTLKSSLEDLLSIVKVQQAQIKSLNDEIKIIQSFRN